MVKGTCEVLYPQHGALRRNNSALLRTRTTVQWHHRKNSQKTPTFKNPESLEADLTLPSLHFINKNELTRAKMS